MKTRDPIIGKVAGVEDEFTILINKGERDGVKLGTAFSVQSSEDGVPVKDPDSGDVIGYRPTQTLEVRVKEVYEKYSVAETFRARSMFDLPGQQGLSGLQAFTVRQRDRINGASSRSEVRDRGPVQVTINIGDLVREVSTDT